MHSTGNNKTDIDHPIEILADDPLDPQYVAYDLGIGGVTDDMAWLELGVLVEKGSKGNQGGGKGR
ncbi:MAG TPA: hypothetical protein VMW85_03850 [Methanomassiliicoccales archaeon]|nr:hypothetical protein [Methanomassiliicoccales archaeon]